MKFKYIVCPKCGKEHIVEYMIYGTPCGCSIQLNADTADNRKDVEKHWRDDAGVFSRTFEEFSRRMQDTKKFWNDNNVFVEFKVVDIPDAVLIKYIKSINAGEIKEACQNSTINK